MEKRNVRTKEKGKENITPKSRKPSENRQRKAVVFGCVTAIVAGVILLSMLSLAMSAGKIPIWAIKGIGLMVGCLLACTAAFVCARYSGQNGFFLGMLCAGVLFAVGMLSSLAVGETAGFWALVKLFAMLLCGCIFGSVGVNLRIERKSH